MNKTIKRELDKFLKESQFEAKSKLQLTNFLLENYTKRKLSKQMFVDYANTMFANEKTLNETLGRLYILGGKNGAYIIDQKGKKHKVEYSQYRDYKNGDVVSFKNAGAENFITKKVDSSSIVDNNINFGDQTNMSGYVFKDRSGKLMFFREFKKGQYKKIEIANNTTGTQNLEGCIVVAKVCEYNQRLVDITEVKGRAADPLAETNAIATEAGIDVIPNAEAQAEAELLPEEVNASLYNLIDENNIAKSSTKKGSFDVVDLRNKMFTTIDPFDCRDMDDSIYTELDADGNYVAYCAIADVTEYVKEKTAMWKNAESAGFTFYTPHDSYPMLPKKLSHGILSLNPFVDRMTLCTRCVIDKNTGKRIEGRNEVFHALINSKQKFSYNQVQQFADSEEYNKTLKEVVNANRKGAVVPTTLNEVTVINKMCADTIRKFHSSRKMLDFDMSNEIQFKLNAEGTKVEDLTVKERLDSMKLIEAHMINSNEVMAEFAFSKNLNVLYRVHDMPSMERVANLNKLLEELDINYIAAPTNSSLTNLFKLVKGSKYEEIVKMVALRCQQKAVYSNLNRPESLYATEDMPCHFGINSDNYCHFTSGIRRMADLVIQSSVKQYLKSKTNKWSEMYVAEMGAHLSEREKSISDAENKTKNLYRAIWAEDNINTILEGRVVKILKDSVIVKCPNTGIEAKVLFENIAGADNSSEFIVYGENREVVLKLADVVEFKLCAADRIGGEVYASFDLEQTYENTYNYENSVEALLDNAERNKRYKQGNTTQKISSNKHQTEKEVRGEKFRTSKKISHKNYIKEEEHKKYTERKESSQKNDRNNKKHKNNRNQKDNGYEY